MDRRVNYPKAQFEFLKQFYNLSFPDIAKKSGVSVGTASNVVNGKYMPNLLRTLAAVADAMNAEVVITLKPRDPRFLERVQAMLPSVTAK